ncbi:MAG: SDR family NAD(P)-dependent oxidoreductase [Enhygromyxa sp.]
MGKRILITGGAGFVGSHLADELINRGYEVRALDNLSEQVHGSTTERPAYLADALELIVGDVRDRDALTRALDQVDAVVHLAAAVGVGQSMYRVADYLDVNCVGTGTLLEALARRPVERLVVASSMSIYGEGLYVSADERPRPGATRSAEQLRAGQWELCDDSGAPLRPVPTPESKAPTLASIYAMSKYAQERMCLMLGESYRIPTVALRFFNIYGTRQALSNPYTGVLAIFAARLLNGRPPLVYEDGLQRRDFVSVKDVARACRLALERPEARGEVFNIGSGEPRSVREVAHELAAVLDKRHIEPEITGEYRVGDIRHCYADIGHARRVLGFEPQVGFAEGLAELGEWLESQVAVDRVAEARRELSSRGLTL